MSFHGLVETPDRSACVASDPSGSRRSSRRCAESTTSSRPSGRKSMHIGNDATVTTTSWLPSVPSAITWFAPQSENQSRPSCQRGDSPNTTPSIRTSPAPTLSLLLADCLVRQTAPELIAHCRLRRGRLLSLLLRRHPGRPRPDTWLVRNGPNSTARLAIEALAAREALEARHDEDCQTRTARSSVAARAEYPVLGTPRWCRADGSPWLWRGHGLPGRGQSTRCRRGGRGTAA